MESIKYVDLIEISPGVLEIQGVENSELAVPVSNTLVHHTAFLAADTRPCILILISTILMKNSRRTNENKLNVKAHLNVSYSEVCSAHCS